MPADKSNEEQIDEMLGRALRRQSEPMPADFTDRMLGRVRQAEEQRILAQVVREERLALAGCIILGIVVIAVVAALPRTASGFAEQTEALIGKIPQIIKAVGCQWQLYTVFTGVFGFAVYGLADLLVGDS